ncbi:MAG: PorT family protein, partial [Muribaculaceae bacterium]|nr:PorT family protein [Muribaculaceae bacterium]
MKMTLKYISAALLAVGAMSAHAQDNRFSVKAHGEIGLGSAMSMSASQAELSHKSSMNSYGVDFGYTFWQHKGMSLSVNAGLDYDMISAELRVGSMNYDYAAGADADMDGNTYRRYYQLNGLSQDFGVEYLSIPVYVNFTYRFNNWVGVYANVGIRPGFKTGEKVKSLSGEVYSYGIYPQYDNLMMDDEWLNDFGNRRLDESQADAPAVSGFNASILAGAGIEAKIYGPLYINAGVNYSAGLTNVFK